MENLSVSEKEVLKYLTTTGKPFNKSHIGVAVGKRQPKNAAAWAGPILESLIEKKLVSTEEQNGRMMYTAATSPAEKTETVEKKNDVLGGINIHKGNTKVKAGKTEVLEAVEPKKKAKVEKTVDLSDLEGSYTTEEIKPVVKEIKKRIKEASTEFNFKKAKREIIKIAEKLISEKKEWESNGSCVSQALREWTEVNGEIPEEFFQRVMRPVKRKLDPTPKREKGLPRTNLLNRLDKEVMKTWAASTWKEIEENDSIAENLKKREFIKVVKNKVATAVPERSMKANMVKSYISTLIRETTTGKEREFKNDGRHFEKGMRVTFKSKTGEIKEGVIVRIFMDKVFFQRTIIVKADGSDKQEMKIDRKIIEVIS